MLVYLNLQIGLVPHFLPEQVGQHSIRTAAVIGQVHRIEIGVIGNDFRTGQNMLPKGPI